MALKLAANLNFLFTEGSPSIADKMKLAHSAGFRAVEIPFPLNCTADVVGAQKDTGIEISLINISLSDKYKLGCASIPGEEQLFAQQLQETISFAKLVNCKKIHLMSGTISGNASDYLNTYKKNLRSASETLEKAGIVGLIEPINKYAVPDYFMNCYETASSTLRDINSGCLKLLLDIFHLQHIRGNITNSFKEMSDIIGHIQIAQVPHRHEPDIAGELDFSYVFSLMKDFGYNDWIGCEYRPKTSTLDGLNWISKYSIQL